jgi:hypothetical protein
MSCGGKLPGAVLSVDLLMAAWYAQPRGKQPFRKLNPISFVSAFDCSSCRFEPECD